MNRTHSFTIPPVNRTVCVVCSKPGQNFIPLTPLQCAWMGKTLGFTLRTGEMHPACKTNLEELMGVKVEKAKAECVIDLTEDDEVVILSTKSLNESSIQEKSKVVGNESKGGKISPSVLHFAAKSTTPLKEVQKKPVSVEKKTHTTSSSQKSSAIPIFKSSSTDKVEKNTSSSQKSSTIPISKSTNTDKIGKAGTVTNPATLSVSKNRLQEEKEKRDAIVQESILQKSRQVHVFKSITADKDLKNSLTEAEQRDAIIQETILQRSRKPIVEKSFCNENLISTGKGMSLFLSMDHVVEPEVFIDKIDDLDSPYLSPVKPKNKFSRDIVKSASASNIVIISDNSNTTVESIPSNSVQAEVLEIFDLKINDIEYDSVCPPGSHSSTRNEVVIEHVDLDTSVITNTQVTLARVSSSFCFIDIDQIEFGSCDYIDKLPKCDLLNNIWNSVPLQLRNCNHGPVFLHGKLTSSTLICSLMDDVAYQNNPNASTSFRYKELDSSVRHRCRGSVLSLWVNLCKSEVTSPSEVMCLVSEFLNACTYARVVNQDASESVTSARGIHLPSSIGIVRCLLSRMLHVATPFNISVNMFDSLRSGLEMDPQLYIPEREDLVLLLTCCSVLCTMLSLKNLSRFKSETGSLDFHSGRKFEKIIMCIKIFEVILKSLQNVTDFSKSDLLLSPTKNTKSLASASKYVFDFLSNSLDMSSQDSMSESISDKISKRDLPFGQPFCRHFDSNQFEKRINNRVSHNNQCNVCSTKSKLWLCLGCGYVACGDLGDKSKSHVSLHECKVRIAYEFSTAIVHCRECNLSRELNSLDSSQICESFDQNVQNFKIKRARSEVDYSEDKSEEILVSKKSRKSRGSIKSLKEDSLDASIYNSQTLEECNTKDFYSYEFSLAASFKKLNENAACGVVDFLNYSGFEVLQDLETLIRSYKCH